MPDAAASLAFLFSSLSLSPSRPWSMSLDLSHSHAHTLTHSLTQTYTHADPRPKLPTQPSQNKRDDSYRPAGTPSHVCVLAAIPFARFEIWHYPHCPPVKPPPRLVRCRCCLSLILSMLGTGHYMPVCLGTLPPGLAAGRGLANGRARVPCSRAAAKPPRPTCNTAWSSLPS